MGNFFGNSNYSSTSLTELRASTSDPENLKLNCETNLLKGLVKNKRFLILVFLIAFKLIKLCLK